MGFHSPFFLYIILSHIMVYIYYDTILYIHIIYVLSRCPICSYPIIHVKRPDLHWGSPESMFRTASFALTAWPKEGPHMLLLRKVPLKSQRICIIMVFIRETMAFPQETRDTYIYDLYVYIVRG